MNPNITTNRALRWAATLGLTTMIAGLFTLKPAFADDDFYRRDHVYRDIADVRRDEDRLHDLYHRRDSEIRRRDWDDVHRLDRQISDLRRHIDHDRRDIHQDIQRDRHDRDRDHSNDNRNHYDGRRDHAYEDRSSTPTQYRNREGNDYGRNRY